MIKRGLIVLIFIPLLLLFHNCGKFKGMTTKSGIAALGCVNEIKPVFEKTMHNFFRSQQCKQCHAEGGEAFGKYFAHSNVDTAFQVFLAFGSDAIKRRVDGGHKYDSKDEAEVKAQLSEAKSEWDSALNSLECGNTAVKTSGKSIPFLNATKPDEDGVPQPIVANTNQIDPIVIIRVSPPNDVPRELSWDLPTGISIKIHIQVQINVFGFITHYLVSDIKAKSDRPVKIKKIKVFLNDNNFAVTTFEGINKTLVGNGNFEALYNGGAAVFQKSTERDVNLVLLDPYTNADAWSVSFELTEPEEAE